jgi:FG-GAP-like repeat/Bacterial Ig-like domain (group 3)
MWTISPSPRFKRPLYSHPDNLFSGRSVLLLHKPELVWFLVLLFLISFVSLQGKATDMTRQATEVTLSVASPEVSPAMTGDSRSFITVTVSVRSGGKSVSPGSVLFCDADAPICEDGAIVGKAQLRTDGTATLRISPGVMARHHSLKAVFAGTTAFQTSDSNVIPLTIPDPPYPPTVTLVSSGTPSSYTLTGTVKGGAYSDTSIPTGQITFVNTTAPSTLGTVNLDSGTEVVTYSALGQVGTTNASPVAMAVADFNNDGLPDLATANAGSQDVSVLWDEGGGGYFIPFTTALTTGSKPTSIATGDFNGDGNVDLVVNNSTGTGITLFLGAGDGTFTVGQTPPSTLANPAAVAVGDFNGDGNLDIAVAGSNRIEVLLGKGDGTFAKQGLMEVVNTPVSLAVADFNGDHFDDLAVGAAGTHNAYILLSNGDGTWATPQKIGTFTNPTAIVAGDFNGDGKPDLNIIDSAGNTVTTLLNNGSGVFHISSIWHTGPAPSAGLATYLNPDGNLDLAVTISGWNRIMLLYGTGQGRFHLGGYLSTGSKPSAIGIGNFMGPSTYEPFPEIVVADKGSSIIEEWQLSYYGQASATLNNVSQIGTGYYTVAAQYSGGGDWDPANSSEIALASYLASSTTLALSASTVTAGTAVKLTAKVTANGSPVSNGIVRFCDAQAATCTGAAWFGSASLNGSGVAAITRTFAIGTHHVNARFIATGTDAKSTSSGKTLTVTP